jgi:hypothetical protein
MYLGRQANECLVKGSSVKDCQQLVSKQTKDLIDKTIQEVSKI